MFETFCDIATNEAANEEAANFIRRKIAEIVKDPETRSQTHPTDLYARRPLCDSGYYETFNRPNVSLVSLKENPDHRRHREGHRHRGRHPARTRCPGRAPPGSTPSTATTSASTSAAATGETLQGPLERRADQLPRRGDHRVPQHVHDPGPQRTVHEPAAVDRDPGRMDRRRYSPQSRPATRAGSMSSRTPRTAWTETCAEIADQTLFPRAASWIFGANIPGKKRTVMFYLGGIKEYRSITGRRTRPRAIRGFLSSADVLAEA